MQCGFLASVITSFIRKSDTAVAPYSTTILEVQMHKDIKNKLQYFGRDERTDLDILFDGSDIRGYFL